MNAQINMYAITVEENKDSKSNGPTHNTYGKI